MKNARIVKVGIGALLAAFLFGMNVNAQEETETTSNFDIGADYVSRYVWRGVQLGGPSPHVQPWMEYSFGESGLAIGFWGSYSTGSDGTGNEADIYLAYAPNEMFSFAVTDYFFPGGGFPSGLSYFDYETDYSKGILPNHTIEVSATGSFGDFYLTAAVNVYGFDGYTVNDDGEASQMYAKYVEAGYSLSDNVDVFVGGSLDDPDEDKGEVGFYGNSMGLTNIGLSFAKDISVTDKFTLPVSSSFIVNPMQEELFLVFGLSL